MEAYNKEDFEEDCNWLGKHGIEIGEAEEFIRSLVTGGFMLDRKGYVTFLKVTR